MCSAVAVRPFRDAGDLKLERLSTLLPIARVIRATNIFCGVKLLSDDPLRPRKRPQLQASDSESLVQSDSDSSCYP